MHKGKPLATSQCIVLVIGTGLGLFLVGGYVTTLGSGSGWVGYAPLTSTQLGALGGLHPWVRLVIWLALLLIWVGTALALLKSRNEVSDS